jgi:hypothetical protein
MPLQYCLLAGTSMSPRPSEQLPVGSPCQAAHRESAAEIAAAPWISGLQRRVSPEPEIDVNSPDGILHVFCEHAADQIGVLGQNDQAREEVAVVQLALPHWLQLDCSQAAPRVASPIRCHVPPEPC